MGDKRNPIFVDNLKKQFGYLESEYGFTAILESNSNLYPQTDGMVKYASNSIGVIIDSETGQAAVRFGRIQDDERYYLDPVFIHEYLNTSEWEKQILLSREIKDKSAADAIFNKTFLLSSPGWKNTREDVNKDLEMRLKNYAK